jgi:hypothetical protein
MMTSALLIFTGSQAVASGAASDEAEVRGVVQKVFEQLKSRQYGELYDLLPANSRSRVSRERFTERLKKTSNMYELERMQIGAVRTSGDIAVVDTVIYGRVLQPIQSEGKIVAQQYLVREDGRWRVATGDVATVRRFLAANPRFKQKFPIRSPHVFIKRDGQWIDINALAAPARRSTR